MRPALQVRSGPNPPSETLQFGGSGRDHTNAKEATVAYLVIQSAVGAIFQQVLREIAKEYAFEQWEMLSRTAESAVFRGGRGHRDLPRPFRAPFKEVPIMRPPVPQAARRLPRLNISSGTEPVPIT